MKLLVLIAVLVGGSVQGGGTLPHLQLGVIKKILLDKLGLTKAPNTEAIEPPQILLERSKRLESNEEFESTDRMTFTTTAERLESNKFKFAFKNTDRFRKQPINLALINFYQDETNAQFVEIKKTESGEIKNVVSIDATEINWISKVITDEIKNLIQRSDPSQEVFEYEVNAECSTDTCFKQLPFIDIEYRTKRLRRNSIAKPCFENSDECCLKSLRITAKQMKWENWFHLPKEFDFTYCSGSCKNQKSSFYSKVYAALNTTGSGGCCVARELKSMRIMHSKGQEFHDKNINGVMAKSCECSGL